MIQFFKRVFTRKSKKEQEPNTPSRMRKLSEEEARQIYGGRPAPGHKSHSHMRKLSKEEARQIYGGRPAPVKKNSN